MHSSRTILIPPISITSSDPSEESSHGPNFTRFLTSHPRNHHPSRNVTIVEGTCSHTESYKDRIRNLSKRLKIKHRLFERRNRQLRDQTTLVCHPQGDVHRFAGTAVSFRLEVESWKALSNHGEMWRDQNIALGASIACVNAPPDAVHGIKSRC